MPRLVAAFALATLAAQAHACPDLDALVERYGITFSGFLAPIPAVGRPALSRDGRIVRTGGLLNVREWYGPVDPEGAKLEQCKVEPEPEPLLEFKVPLRRKT